MAEEGWQERLGELWDEVEHLERREAREKGGLEVSIRALAGDLMAELTVNGRCTAGQLCEELCRMVEPQVGCEYRLALGTRALRPSDTLRDVVTNGAELTALVVESCAGEFSCEARGTRSTLCLGPDRRARCHLAKSLGGMVIHQALEGAWEEQEQEVSVTLYRDVDGMNVVIRCLKFI